MTFDMSGRHRLAGEGPLDERDRQLLKVDTTLCDGLWTGPTLKVRRCLFVALRGNAKQLRCA